MKKKIDYARAAQINVELTNLVKIWLCYSYVQIFFFFYT